MGSHRVGHDLAAAAARTSFKLYLAFLAFGGLTYKLLASVTGSGNALGVFCHLKLHVTITIIVSINFI